MSQRRPSQDPLEHWVYGILIPRDFMGSGRPWSDKKQKWIEAKLQKMEDPVTLEQYRRFCALDEIYRNARRLWGPSELSIVSYKGDFCDVLILADVFTCQWAMPPSDIVEAFVTKFPMKREPRWYKRV